MVADDPDILFTKSQKWRIFFYHGYRSIAAFFSTHTKNQYGQNKLTKIHSKIAAPWISKNCWSMLTATTSQTQWPTLAELWCDGLSYQLRSPTYATNKWCQQTKLRPIHPFGLALNLDRTRTPATQNWCSTSPKSPTSAQCQILESEHNWICQILCDRIGQTKRSCDFN